MTERRRYDKREPRVDANTRIPEFINPFSYMSSDDARVTLELYNRNVPFSYRYFDGDAPQTKKLMPDFAPEFTLSEYKTVIMVEGGFFGSLPGVLDKAALAQALLQADGWKVIVLFESDIVHNLKAVLDKQFPESINPTITGGEKPSPYAPPHWMFTKRQWLRGLSLLRQYSDKVRNFVRPHSTKVSVNEPHVRSKHLRLRDSDSGRYRPLSQRYRKSPE